MTFLVRQYERIPVILIDSHVHIYEFYDLKLLLDAALLNFDRAAKHHANGEDVHYILFLTEGRGFNWFRRLTLNDISIACSAHRRLGEWRVKEIYNEGGLLVKNREGRGVFIIAGRQISTAEGIEVLALFTSKFFDDFQPAVTSIEAVLQEEAIPILPWSPGKWFGRRGVLVDEILQDRGEKNIFLGDIFGRPRIWPTPKAFRIARRRQIGTLVGTDPLPIEGQEKQVGCFGTLMDAHIDLSNPVDCLKNLLQKNKNRLSTFGKPIGFSLFLKNQLMLRLPVRRP